MGREREGGRECSGLLLSICYSIQVPVSGKASLTFRPDLPSLANPLWKCHQRHPHLISDLRGNCNVGHRCLVTSFIVSRDFPLYPTGEGFLFFYHKRILDHIVSFLCILRWSYDISSSWWVVMHYWFACVEPPLHPWGKFYLSVLCVSAVLLALISCWELHLGTWLSPLLWTLSSLGIWCLLENALWPDKDNLCSVAVGEMSGKCLLVPLFYSLV